MIEQTAGNATAIATPPQFQDTIRVLVADDHAIVRKGICALLATEPRIQVVGEARDGNDAIAAAQRLQPDVILMDIVMPGVDGLEATRRLASSQPQVRILVLTSFAGDDKIFPAIKAGALGYLLKDSGPEVEKECYACRYYKEIYYPRVQFVNQIDQPASVYGDLYFYYGNQQWAELCGVNENDLIGLGIENVVHPESLGIMMSDTKKRTMGDSTVPRSYSIFLKNNEKSKIDISIYPLNNPQNTFLIVGD